MNNQMKDLIMSYSLVVQCQQFVLGKRRSQTEEQCRMMRQVLPNVLRKRLLMINN